MQGSSPPSGCFGVRCPPKKCWGCSVGVQLPGYPEIDGCGAALGTPKSMCMVWGCSKHPKKKVCVVGLLWAPQSWCVQHGVAPSTPKPMCVVWGCSKLPKSDVSSTGLLLAPQNRCVPCVGLLQAPQKCLESDVSLVAGTPGPPQTDVSLSGTAPGTPKVTCPGTGLLWTPQN